MGDQGNGNAAQRFQDKFDALNQVLLDEERRKRREKKERTKRKKERRRRSPSSRSNGIREDVNPQDKSAAVEALSGVELQETAPDPIDKIAYGVKLDDNAATDSSSRPRGRGQRMQHGHKNVSF